MLIRILYNNFVSTGIMVYGNTWYLVVRNCIKLLIYILRGFYVDDDWSRCLKGIYRHYRLHIKDNKLFCLSKTRQKSVCLFNVVNVGYLTTNLQSFEDIADSKHNVFYKVS